jgi:N-methylhydantoinase B/oxoprolinase/acetone carboxylase alpha subunit
MPLNFHHSRLILARMGGWGDPFSRDPQLVLRDVRDAVVSVEGAARDYGVVIGSDGRSVDFEATAALRTSRGYRCSGNKLEI